MTSLTLAAAALPRPKRELLALLLIIPAPCISAIVGLLLGEGALGVALWALAKVWMLVVPLWWHVKVEGKKLELPRMRGLFTGAALGLAMAVAVLSAYFVFGQSWIDPSVIRATLEPTGLVNIPVYLGVAAFWILGNSVLEEFVYRWFVYERATGLVGAKWAMVVSAGAFVLHHLVSMAAYFDWRVTTIGCLGVFVGGLIWSWLYARTRSIAAPYISHAIVDVAVFTIGAILLFGW
jgi:uncharacterized protein